MALPNQFATATDATGAQLDANFAALGALTPIPCVAAGGNTITLAPLANTPVITAYANYGQYTGIAAASNTGAATAKVGSLATLSIFKAGPSGPIALTGGEIVGGVGFNLLYDAALNSGGGGFHLMGAGAVTFAGGTITGPIVGSGSLATIIYPVATFPLLNGVTLASIARLSVGGGSTVSRMLYTTASISFTALLPQTGSLATVALAGVSINDIVSLGLPAAASIGVSFRGMVLGTGSIGIQAFNGTSGTVTPGGGTYGVQAIGY